VDQKCQVQEIAGLRGKLDKLKDAHKEEVDLLHTRVETLGKDKSALEERSKYLQEKNKKLTKDHKGNSLVFLVLVTA
jgi:chaperonin cofactor prefoldin